MGLCVHDTVSVCACLLASRSALLKLEQPAPAPARWASAHGATPFAAAPVVWNRHWCVVAAALVCQLGLAGCGILVGRVWSMVMLDVKLLSSVLGGFGRDVKSSC